MIPVCVITYNHPKYDFIDRVMTDKAYADKKFNHPLYYFIYDRDWDTFNYDYYKDKFEELHFVKVPFAEYAKAQRMRVFVQNYMRDFDFFWLLDNDVALGARKYDYTVNKMINIDSNQFLDEWESFDIENYAIMCPCQFWMGIKHEVKPDGEFGFARNPIQYVLLNNKAMKEHNIHYTGDINVAEDMELGIQCLSNGLKLGELYNYFVGNANSGGMGSGGWYNLEQLVKNTYEKHKDSGYLKLKTDKKGNAKLSLLKQQDLKLDLWD